jgi:hypothetical protein
MKIQTAGLVVSVLFLSACGTADVDGMQKGLAKGGMSAASAKCYANALKEVIGVDEYNNLAKLMQEGSSLTEAVKKTRRKFGAEFKTAMSANSDTLDACQQKP